jgi:hypothetical protein
MHAGALTMGGSGQAEWLASKKCLIFSVGF